MPDLKASDGIFRRTGSREIHKKGNIVYCTVTHRDAIPFGDIASEVN